MHESNQARPNYRKNFGEPGVPPFTTKVAKTSVQLYRIRKNCLRGQKPRSAKKISKKFKNLHLLGCKLTCCELDPEMKFFRI